MYTEDCADSDVLVKPVSNIYKITRELKREQNSLFNCLNSILADSAFINEISDLYPNVPLLANLRCGLWYTTKPDGTCYFKSTDGHNGNWSFSCTRLNWHVAELAAAAGGCLVVDATRKGKRFPDALTKTVPIWAAVINRAVARVRASPQHGLGGANVCNAAQQQNIGSAGSSGYEIGAQATSPRFCRSHSLPRRMVAEREPSLMEWLDIMTTIDGTDSSNSDRRFPNEPPLVVAGTLTRADSCCIGSGTGAVSNSLQVGLVEGFASPFGDPTVQQQSLGVLPTEPSSSCRPPMAAGDSSCGSLSTSAPQPSLAGWCSVLTAVQPEQRHSGMGPAETSNRVVTCDHSSPTTMKRKTSQELSPGVLCHALELGSSAAANSLLGSPTMFTFSHAAVSWDPILTVGCNEANSPNGQQLLGDAAPLLERSARITPMQDPPGPAMRSRHEQLSRSGSLNSPTRACIPRRPCLCGDGSSCRPQLAAPSTWQSSVHASWQSTSSLAQHPGLATGMADGASLVPIGPTAGTASHDAAGQLSIGSPNSTSPTTFGSCSPTQQLSTCITCGPSLKAGRTQGTPQAPLVTRNSSASLEGVLEAIVRVLKDNPNMTRPHAAAGGGTEHPTCPGSATVTCTGPSMNGSREGGPSTSAAGGAAPAPHNAASGSDPSFALPPAGTSMAGMPAAGGVAGPGTAGGVAGSLRVMAGAATAGSSTASIPSAFAAACSGAVRSSCDGCAASAGCSPVGCSGGARPSALGSGGVARSAGDGGGKTSASAGGGGGGRGMRSAFAGGGGSMTSASAGGGGGMTSASAGGGGMSFASARGGGGMTSASAGGDGGMSSASVGGDCSTRSASANRNGGGTTSASAGGFDAGSCSSPAWDTSLHLPPWISRNEAQQIERRLDGWVDALMAMGADVAGLAARLTKPLRPLWVSQASLIWVDQVAQPEDLDFTPLILVSASQPTPYQRQTVAPGASDKDEQWTYVYVPGAGDDEESWAGGLTPQMLWQNARALVAAGPSGLPGMVRELLRCSALPPQAASNPPSGGAATAGAYVQTDAHHRRPQGCEGGAAEVRCTASGLHWIGSTGLAIGPISSGEPPTVWHHVHAVLNLGATQHPAMAAMAAAAASPQSPHGQPPRPGPYLWLPVQDAKHERASLLGALGSALRFVSHHLQLGHRVLIHDVDGYDSCVCVTVAVLLACFSGGDAEGRALPRYHGGWNPSRPPPAPVTKHSVRQRLAVVSAAYPRSRPTRGMLKQVFNFFEGLAHPRLPEGFDNS